MSDRSPDTLARVKSGLKTGGPLYLIRAALSHIPSGIFFYDRQLLMLAENINVIVRKYADYEVRFLNADDFGGLSGFNFSKAIARRELEEGSVCLAVLKGKRAVSWRWAAIGDLYVPYCNITVHTGGRGYYTYRLETVPEERHRGHVNVCLKMMQDHFRERGRPDDYTLISARNIPNLKMHRRCGFKIIGRITVLNLLGLHFCFYKQWPYHSKRWTCHFGRTPRGMRAV